MPWTNNPSGGLDAIPTNGGTGFQAWTSQEVGNINNGFYFLASSVADNFGNVNSSNGRAFGMAASGVGNTVNCWRKMRLPLMVGGSFTVKFATRFRNGYKGLVVLRQSTPVFTFDVTNLLSSQDQYRYATTWNGTQFINYTNTNWIYSGTSLFTLSVHRPTSNVCAFRVLRDADATDPTPEDSGPIVITSNTDVDEVQFYCSQTDAGADNNLYFNFLSAYNAYPLP